MWLVTPPLATPATRSPGLEGRLLLPALTQRTRGRGGKRVSATKLKQKRDPVVIEWATLWPGGASSSPGYAA